MIMLAASRSNLISFEITDLNKKVLNYQQVKIYVPDATNCIRMSPVVSEDYFFSGYLLAMCSTRKQVSACSSDRHRGYTRVLIRWLACCRPCSVFLQGHFVLFESILSHDMADNAPLVPWPAIDDSDERVAGVQPARALNGRHAQSLSKFCGPNWKHAGRKKFNV